MTAEILLTYVTTNPRGQPQRDQRRVTGPVLAIGRGTQCQIQLPDPRVAIAHARITVTENGDASIAADSGSIEINDQILDGAPLCVGDRISVGPYSFQVDAPPAGIPLALTITLTSPLATKLAGSDEKSAAKFKHSKRRLSYLLFFGVLLLCLLVPVAADTLGYFAGATKAGVEGVQAASMILTRLWNPGTLSRSHQVFKDDCRACHQLPFVQVRDAACLECHRTIKEHIDPARLTGPHGSVMQETRCAECHRDHKDMPLATRSQQQCVDCHHDVKRFADGAHSENVTDFRADHPQFRLSLPGPDQSAHKRSIRQGTPEAAIAEEHSNLKFNHKLHLDPRGVRDPGGTSREVSVTKAMSDEKKRHPLVCADCHVADQAGKQMLPISMEQHCQRCHSLAFEPKVTPRQVPHGSEQAVATMLREFYARLALGDVPPDLNVAALDALDMQRVRPGSVLTYKDRQRVLQIAETKAQLALKELFVTRDVCSTCHVVHPNVNPGSENAGWKVEPVRLATQWMPQASFSHEKHLTQKCTVCHNVGASTKAENIAMPDIKICRECHVGAQPMAGKVSSDCASCHKFHFGGDAWHGLTAQASPGSTAVSPHVAMKTPPQKKEPK